MSDPLSTAEGVADVDELLSREKVNAIDKNTDQRLTVRVDWSQAFHRDLARFSEERNGLSRTECEMVLAHEAIAFANKKISDTNVMWVKPLQFLTDGIVDGTQQYRDYGNKVERFKDSVGGLTLSNNDQGKKVLTVAEKTRNKLKQDTDLYGVSKKTRLRVGLSKLVIRNPGKFNNNTKSHAKDDWSETKVWFEGASQTAKLMARSIGRTIAEAAKEGRVHELFLKEELKNIKVSHEELYEYLSADIDGEILEII